MSVGQNQNRRPERHRPRPSARAGFTLVEIMVAMAVFAVLALAAYGALSSLLRTRVAVVEDSQRLARVQKTLLGMGRDLLQVTPRPIRDGYGELLSAISHDPGQPLVLTRGGRTNPTGLARSSLQRVGYQLEDGILYRLRWSVLDSPIGSEPARQELLDRVQELTFRFRDSSSWLEYWPSADLINQPGWETLMPRAVEVVLELEGLGRITRIFLVRED